MLNKLIEKGKKYLKDKNKKEQKDSPLQQNSGKGDNEVNENSAKRHQYQRQSSRKNSSISGPKTLEEKTNYLVKKTTFHSDKLMNLTQTIIEFNKQNKLNKEEYNALCSRLKNSILYKENYHSSSDQIRKYIKKNSIKQIDFLEENFQKFLSEQLLSAQLQQENEEEEERKQDSNEEQNNQEKDPLFCIAVVQFHHKLGSVVEYSYPQGIQQEIQDKLTYMGLPDAIHNKDEDFIFFTIEHKVDEKSEILYGVSYFKQIKVTEEMRQKNQDLTRNQMQKSVCVLSRLPLLGYLVSRIAPTTKAYFSQTDFEDYSILQSAFNSINTVLKETQSNLEESEVFLGTSPKSLLYQFKDKVLVVLKAILLEGKIIVYSLNSQACSNFILSLLSLFPGMLYFNYSNKNISHIELELKDYGMPFRLFDQSDRQLQIYFTIQQLDELSKNKSFLIGTTNILIKENKNANLIVDIDKKQLIFKNSEFESKCKLNNKEKRYMELILKNIQNHILEHEKSWLELGQNIFCLDTEWEGSNDYFRHQFHQYFKEMVVEFALYQKNLNQIESDYRNMLTQNEKFFFGDNQEMQGMENPNGSNSDINSNMDGETMMAMGNNTQETSKSRFIKKMREILLSNEKALRKYNIKFLTHWIQTDNFKFWVEQKHSRIYKRSVNFDLDDQSKEEAIVLDAGDIYYGKINRGLKQGQGIFYDISQQRQTNTTYKNSQKQGLTKIKSLKEDFSFEGNYLDDMKNGAGHFVVKGKFNYQGQFQNDKFSIHGLLIDKNGNEYEGEFLNGMKNGMGKLKYTNGDMYIGTFKNDVFDGKGQLVYKNGDVYSGDFKEGKKYGIGELQYGSGKKYEGEFQSDKFEGQGHLYLEGGVIIQGLFSNNEIVEGLDQIIKFKNGDVWSGGVKNQKMHGEGIYSKSDGSIQYAVYDQGQFVQELEDKEVEDKLKRFENNLQEIEDNDPNEAIIEKDTYKVQEDQEDYL